jgi:hypothetical protein
MGLIISRENYVSNLSNSKEKIIDKNALRLYILSNYYRYRITTR